MERTISTVFKIIICTVLIGMLYTLTVCLIDVFVTIDRVQGIAEFVEIDVAKNNCMLNDVYETTVNQLFDVCKKSRYMKVCTSGEGNPYGGSWSNSVTGKVPLELYNSGNESAASVGSHTCKAYIQENVGSSTTLQTGVVPATITNTKSGDTFCVANYGDILVMRINASIKPTMWTIDPSEGIEKNGWLDFGVVPLSLTYYIPALTYLK